MFWFHFERLLTGAGQAPEGALSFDTNEELNDEVNKLIDTDPKSFMQIFANVMARNAVNLPRNATDEDVASVGGEIHQVTDQEVDKFIKDREKSNKGQGQENQ